MKSDKEENMLTRYLLGKATQEESDRIEDLYFRSPDYHEQLLALEEELICRYVRNELPAPDRSQFESQFLTSDRRRRKFEATRDLVSFLSESYAPAPTRPAVRNLPRNSWLERFFSNFRLAADWRLAGAVATLCFVAITATLSFLNFRHGNAPDQHGNLSRTRQPIADPTTPQSASGPLDQPGLGAAPAPVAPSPKPRVVNGPRPSIETPPSADRSVTPAVIINLGAFRTLDNRDNLTEISISAAASEIQLHLPLEELKYRVYQATIKRYENGNVVWQESQLRPRQTKSGNSLVLTIPGQTLEESDYVINVHALTKTGVMKLINESFFNVKRK